MACQQAVRGGPLLTARTCTGTLPRGLPPSGSMAGMRTGPRCSIILEPPWSVSAAPNPPCCPTWSPAPPCPPGADPTACLPTPSRHTGGRVARRRQVLSPESSQEDGPDTMTDQLREALQRGPPAAAAAAASPSRGASQDARVRCSGLPALSVGRRPRLAACMIEPCRAAGRVTSAAVR